MNKSPLVSVNIRTYNSAKTIRETLESVKKQTYFNIEILVSDGFSRDETLSIAKSYGVKINYADKLGDARYENYKRSKGKYLLSLDSDQVLDPNLIEVCVRLCEVKNLDALTISEKSLIGKGTFLEKLISFDKLIIDKSRDDDLVFGTACPRFFRKDILRKVNWRKQLAIFDDTILYSELLKKGASVKYISSSSIRHHEVESWIVLCKKFFRYGKGYFEALKNEPGTIMAHSLPRRSYFTKIALARPIYFLGLLFLYLVKAFAASVGVLAYFTTSLFSSKISSSETN